MPLSKKDITTRVQEEHGHLKQEMEKIWQLIDAEVSKDEFVQWRMDLLFLLRDFHNDLQKHFDLEEEGGFMSDIVRVAPQHTHAVAQLYEEHQQMSSGLNTILADLKALTTMERTEFNRIRSQIEDFLTLLKTHEAAEGNLMVSTYLQDEGSGD